MEDVYGNLRSALSRTGRENACNKSALMELLASDDVARIIKFDTSEERDHKYDCFVKLVRRCDAQDVIDVIRRKDYVLLVKTYTDFEA